MKQPKDVLAIAHNMARFDGHLILQAIVNMRNNEKWCEKEILGRKLHKLKFEALKDSNESYKTFTLRPSPSGL